MIAPFGPDPQIVSKLMSCSALVARRKPSSACTTSISVSPPLGGLASSQHRNSTIAAPSRRCASRVPAISAAFLRPWAGGRDHRPRRPRRPPPARSCATASGAVAWSTRTGPGQRAQGRHKGLRPGAACTCGAQMRPHGRRRTWPASANSVDPPVIVQDGKAVQHRVARHIRAADVQKPADANRAASSPPPAAPPSRSSLGQPRALGRRWFRRPAHRDAQRPGPAAAAG